MLGLEIWLLTRLQFAPRDEAVKLKRAIVNPADQYKEKGEALHKYGQYIMSCLPKYVQQ
jgi:NADH dehydrogenase (ubiquinone) Fe-S protein 3